MEKKPDPIMMEVRCRKSENPAAYGFNLRKIAESAQTWQHEHPERMVTCVPPSTEKALVHQPLTRPVAQNELKLSRFSATH